VKKITYCRICEPLCGLVATVEDGRLISVAPDKENPHSLGFMCAKASGMIDITYDPDRILRPLRRVGNPGDFEPVSWEDALGDIATRLCAIRARCGPRAVAGFIGNPPFFNYSATLAFDGFLKAIGSPWKYCINSEDGAARLAANAILYGSSAIMLKPDLWRTDFALIIGANPFVSRGSMVSEPQIRRALHGIVERGDGSSSSTRGGAKRPSASNTSPSERGATPGFF
jgi:anaerobic selenocysteine-containing dehydrogenase